MENSKKNSMLNGAFVLMIAILMVKVIGVLFKMPMTNMLGAVGRGYFSSAYEIYTPIFAISMAGLPVAVSRMVAEAVALEKYRHARAIFMTSKKVFFIVGVSGLAVLLIAAVPYCMLTDWDNLKGILCVAPSIFLCCYMSAYRGYYEGLRNMVPTAISQVIEALGKLILGLAFIKVIMMRGQAAIAGVDWETVEYVKVFGTKVTSEVEALTVTQCWAAAGAVLGVTLGSFLSLMYLILCHRVRGDHFTGEMLAASPAAGKGGDIAKEMIKIAIPMVISALILNITNLIDTTTIQARLATALTLNRDMVITQHAAFKAAKELGRINIDNDKAIVKYLWGAYGTALDFKSLVPTITIQLGVSAIPALATAWAVKNKDNIRSTIETVIRVGMLIALPAGFGIAFLATPILNIIYGRGNSNESISLIAPILITYGIFTPIMAISTPTTNMLQAVGRADIPMKSVAVAAVCKIICNFFLVGNPKFNIYGAVFGTVLFYVLIVSVNMFSLLRVSKVRVNWLSVFLKPCISALLCGITAFATHGIIVRLIPETVLTGDTTASIVNTSTIGAILGIGLGAIVYFISILLLRGIAKEDVVTLPKGEKIAKVLEKYRLLG